MLIYGLKNGSIGAIELTKDEGIVLWEYDVMDSKSAVAHIKCENFVDQNIILARDSGEIEVYSYSESSEAELVFETKEAHEAITGIAVGNITSPAKKEIIYSCYSGVIKSICHRSNAKTIGLATEFA